MITKENVSKIIELDSYSEPYYYKDQMYVSYPCVFPCVDIAIGDTWELIKAADEKRKQEGNMPFYYGDINEIDSEGTYRFHVELSEKHEGSYEPHVDGISFEIQSDKAEDGYGVNRLELTDEELTILYDYLNGKLKEQFGLDIEEMLADCEAKAPWD